ncbi:hypothetical protein V6N12_059911 [Hibiscus sabdariffa]|uniref:Uncharacterized protein n=1 Tax=Hibiscus sabdariffa TaxID=183260 RepID=A0ABR2D4N4_9ROSI
MPAGVMIPARNMPSMITGNGNASGFGTSSSSGLSLGQQPNNMMEGQLHPLEMTQNTLESEFARMRDDEFDSTNKSGSENHELGGSGDDQDLRPNKKKRYHRHTQHQIQEMEAEALSTASCPNCGGPTAVGQMSFDEHQLRLENARLREEIDRISAIAAKYVGKPLGNFPLLSSPVPPRPFDFGAQPVSEEMYGVGDLLSLDGSTCVLNEEEYIRTFPSGIEPKPTGFISEASRETAVVIMNHINLVEILMDVHQWSTVFSGIVSKASTLDVLSTGVAGNFNGALQVMTAEFQVPSPLVPTLITNQDGRKSMLKLAERMVISFCGGVSASTAHTWTTLSGTGADDVRVMTRKSVDDPGRPPGIVLSAATSFWLPVSPKRVFDFLRDENSRNEWDILSNGGAVQEMAHIANGHDPGNCVSLLRVNSANSSQGNMLILQESCTDPTASFVIYAPVDIVAMNVVLNGGDPDYVALLPSGFAILPDGTDGGIADAGVSAILARKVINLRREIKGEIKELRGKFDLWNYREEKG